MAAVPADPVLPWRIPTPVIALLAVVIVLVTLAGAGLVGMLALGGRVGGMRGLDLAWPDDPVGRVVWVQGALTVAAMVLVWLLSILVVAAHAAGAHRNAAVNAVALVRVAIAVMVVRFLAGAAVPVVLSGSWAAGATVLASGAPLVVAQIALLIAADAYFSAVRQNALL